MKTIILDDFLSQGILIEKKFRKKVDDISWEEYKDDNVLIKDVAKRQASTWAYLIITAN